MPGTTDMATAFERAWRFTMGTEGGYWDDPVGGPTMYGITERVARQWGYKGAMQQMPLDLAQQIARADYWDRYGCEQLPAAFGVLVFDTVYNGGAAVAWLQTILGVLADGRVGAKTVAAARAANQPQVCALFCARRLRYMQSLANWKPNAGGWSLRIAALIEETCK